jgi:hypothetical protein
MSKKNIENLLNFLDEIDNKIFDQFKKLDKIDHEIIKIIFKFNKIKQNKMISRKDLDLLKIKIAKKFKLEKKEIFNRFDKLEKLKFF